MDDQEQTRSFLDIDEQPISYEDLVRLAQYRTLSICKALDIKRERLRDWTKEGHIKPTLPAHGQGTKAGFTLGDVYAIALFKKLTDIGFKRELSATIIKNMIGVFNSPIVFNQYLACVLKNKDDEQEVVVRWFAHGDGKDDLTVKCDSFSVEFGMPPIKTTESDWEEMFLFNLIQLRKEVDNALSLAGENM